VLASPSHGEAFPNVVGESMACGVPCAVTDVGDSAYIVGDTGRVVLAGDMPALATAIELLIGMPEDGLRALGAHARARIVEHFELGQIVKRYENFFEQLIATGRSGAASR